MPARKFYKTLYNSDTFKQTGTTRPVSAIENNYNSNTKISENSKDSFLNENKGIKIMKVSTGITQRYEIHKLINLELKMVS